MRMKNWLENTLTIALIRMRLKREQDILDLNDCQDSLNDLLEHIDE